MTGANGANFDLHSTYNASAPSGEWIYVRLNAYETKRANVTIYNWDLAPSVAVDLSKVLSVGDSYVIQDAQNFYGPPVVSGTYAGGTVNIPMTGLTKATPIGVAAPAHTGSALRSLHRIARYAVVSLDFNNWAAKNLP